MGHQFHSRTEVRKTTAYARKIRRTGPGFNGAAWMNTMERCRPYTDEPILPCFQPAGTLSAAVKSALVVREAFETLRTGEDSTGSGDPWDILAHAVDVGTIRAIEIAGNDPDKNPMLPIMLKANAALKRIRERHDRLGKWALDGSAVVELRAAMDVYQEILMASSPAQMSKAAEVRMSVIAGKPSKIIEMPTP
jgi:hypothetical protein